MTDRLITADARKISGREFFDAITGRRTPEEQAERVRLAREHQNAVQASYALPHEQGKKERARLNAAFVALVKAGKTERMLLTDDRSNLEILAEEALAEVRVRDQVERELRQTIEMDKRRAA